MEKENGPIHSQISFLFSAVAIIGMLYLGFKHINDIDEYGGAWGQFAILQGVLGLVGFLAIDYLDDGKITIIPTKYAVIGEKTFYSFALAIGSILVIQLITKFARYTITDTERGLYYIFSSINEELFFRGLISNVSLRIGKSPLMKLTGSAISGFIFTLMHVNYYDNVPMLISVFVGGFALSIIYMYYRDLTGIILGHFILNFLLSLSVFGVFNL